MGNGSTLPVAWDSVDLFSSFFIEFIERKRWRTVDSKAVRPELTQYVSACRRLPRPPPPIRVSIFNYTRVPVQCPRPLPAKINRPAPGVGNVVPTGRACTLPGYLADRARRPRLRPLPAPRALRQNEL